MESYKFESAKNTIESVKDKIKKYAIYFAMFASSCTTAVKTEGNQNQESKNPIHNEAQYRENVKIIENLVQLSDNWETSFAMNTGTMSALQGESGVLPQDKLWLNSIDIQENTTQNEQDSLISTGVSVQGTYRKGLGEDKNQIYKVYFRDTNSDGQADVFNVEESVEDLGSGALETPMKKKIIDSETLNREQVMQTLDNSEAQKLLNEVDLVFHEVLVLAERENERLNKGPQRGTGDIEL